MSDIRKTIDDLQLLNSLCHGSVLDDAIELLKERREEIESHRSSSDVALDADAEKVVRGWERCRKCHELPNLFSKDFKDCEYTMGMYCRQDRLIDDTIALLKEHEKEIQYRTPKKITHTATKLGNATCPSCGNVVGEKQIMGDSEVLIQWKYCKFCGQELDWGMR